ncbi:RNA polymerase sigma-70 factor (sigma-E family) [Kribbella voronezhensis]|uniref:RNA polymerase sigma-70 factor (Sigma-E family) n=1 Tax=Kribbella voronezhensis TaxID=2512212 RepID=A0A4V3FJS9_9ACTN|nr:RNA polymerase sigma-70 factor (sigma-E family) [Kribbella voronezhensis]
MQRFTPRGVLGGVTNHIVALVQSEGTPVAISELYRQHWVGLVRLAVLVVDDPESAEDVVQEVFTELYRKWPLDDSAKVLGYLRTAVLNRSRSVLRRRRVARLYIPPSARSGDSAESAAELGESRREVQRALQALPIRSREVLVLRYYLDLPYAEIAQTLGISESTARATSSRALAALTKKLKEPR